MALSRYPVKALSKVNVSGASIGADEAGAEVVEVAIEVVGTDDSTLTDGSEAELTAVETLVISDVDAPVDDVPPPQATNNKVVEITKKDSLRLFIY